MIYGTVEFRHGLYKYGTGKLHTRRSAGWAGLEGIDGKYGMEYTSKVCISENSGKINIDKGNGNGNSKGNILN